MVASVDELAMVETLGGLREQILKISRDRFSERFPHSWLIGLGGAALAAPSAAFRTVDDRGGESTPSDLRVGPEARIWAVRKRVSSFPDKIMVGRAPNNDVVIAQPHLSKLHAFFGIRDGQVTLADAGSRNGTFVNDRPLETMVPADIADQDLIRFGALSAVVFMSSGSLWDAVRSGLMG